METLPDAIILKQKYQSDVVDAILEAARRGLTGITYPNLSDTIITQLQKKGYKVDKFGTHMYMIKWD
jgi:hypothetical protein